MQSGVSFGAIHNDGLGLRKPTFIAALRIARALSVTCETFTDCDDLGGTAGAGRPAPPPRAGRRDAAGDPGDDSPPRRRPRKRR